MKDRKEVDFVIRSFQQIIGLVQKHDLIHLACDSTLVQTMQSAVDLLKESETVEHALSVLKRAGWKEEGTP